MKTKTSFKKGHLPTYTAQRKDHVQYKHGFGSTKNRNPLYNKWSGMKRRCYNKNERSYKDYGGRGIVVSKSWLEFINFYNDMASTYKKGLSIERIDNNKGYSKENCRWITMAEQAKNKRNVKLYSHNGMRHSIAEWEVIGGFKKDSLRARMKYGWSFKMAIETPLSRSKGYTKDKRGGYRIEIKKSGRRYFIGRFKTIVEALSARNEFLANLQK